MNNNIKIEFFEPPMCCPTGLCGPTLDQKLVTLSENIENLKQKYPGIVIERYMLTMQPMKFRENKEVYKLIQEQGKGVLPITTVNGEVIKIQAYPELSEMEEKIRSV
jgi:hypothetical protein